MTACQVFSNTLIKTIWMSFFIVIVHFSLGCGIQMLAERYKMIRRYLTDLFPLSQKVRGHAFATGHTDPCFQVRMSNRQPVHNDAMALSGQGALCGNALGDSIILAQLAQ